MATDETDAETEIKTGYLTKQGKNILLSSTFISLRDCVLNAVTLVTLLHLFAKVENIETGRSVILSSKAAVYSTLSTRVILLQKETLT